MEPLGAPWERIGDGALNKDVSNMAKMMTACVIEDLFFFFWIGLDIFYR